MIAALLSLKEIAVPAERRAYTLDDATAHGVETLARKVLRGVVKDRRRPRCVSGVRLVETPTGVPRARGATHRLIDLFDDDPAHLAAWCAAPEPCLPSTLRRTLRRDPIGSLCVVRDSSSSMAGPKALWASRVALALFRRTRAARLPAAFLDFSDRDDLGDNSVVRGYDHCERLAASTECGGLTNLHHALLTVLDDFQAKDDDDHSMRRRGASARRRHHIVLVTDGHPTEGSLDDLYVQVRRAAERGVAVHSVFIGRPDVFPDDLARIAHITKGSLFHAAPRLPATSSGDDHETRLLLATAQNIAIDLLDARRSAHSA